MNLTNGSTWTRSASRRAPVTLYVRHNMKISHMEDIKNFNRVLLTKPIGFVDRPDGKKGAVVDGTSLSFIVEDVIALSAVSIVIPSTHHAAGFVDKLDPVIGKRVEVAKITASYNQFMALFEPVTEEFSVEFDFGFSCKTESTVGAAISRIYFDVMDYFIAKNYKTELDIDKKRLSESLELVKNASKSSESRAVLSVLQGIFNTYGGYSINSLRVTSQAKSELIHIFDDLVEDRLYQQASAKTHQIGLPLLAKRSLVLAGRALESFLKKTPFRHVLNLGSRAIEAATTVPMPDSDMAQELLASGYLPPLTKIGDTVSSALKKWERVKPDPMYPKNFK